MTRHATVVFFSAFVLLAVSQTAIAEVNLNTLYSNLNTNSKLVLHQNYAQLLYREEEHAYGLFAERFRFEMPKSGYLAPGEPPDRQIKSHKIGVLVEKQLAGDSELALRFATHNSVRMQGEKNRRINTGAVHYRSVLAKDRFHIKALFQRDFFHVDSDLQPSGIGMIVKNESKAQLGWFFTAQTKLTVEQHHTHLSDSNTKEESRLSFDYGLSPDWPWIWLSAYVGITTYEKRSQLYWSPPKYQSLGLRLDAVFPVTETLNGQLGASLGKNEEADIYHSTSGSLYIGGEWRFQNRLQLTARFSRAESEQGGSRWYQKSSSISFRWEF